MGRHPHKEIRKALAEAEIAGLAVVELQGHTWGRVQCPCGDHVKVFSTGRAPEIGAKRVRAFINKHEKHVLEG